MISPEAGKRPDSVLGKSRNRTHLMHIIKVDLNFLLLFLLLKSLPYDIFIQHLLVLLNAEVGINKNQTIFLIHQTKQSQSPALCLSFPFCN